MASDIDENRGTGTSIRTLSRGLAVLQAINRIGSAPMKDIQKACDLPFPTVMRIVQSLANYGLIEREPKRRYYRPTALVQTLSHGYQGDSRLAKIARPHLVELTREVSWPIILSTHVGHSMVIRDSTHALSALTFNEYFPGYASPILESAAGLAYLAALPEEESALILGSIAKMANPDWGNILEDMRQRDILVQVREQGHATRSFNRFTRNPGKTSSIAAAVFEHDRPRGAIALAYFASAMRPEHAVRQFVPPLRACAAAISTELSAIPQDKT
ncbi:helix-turn-helix domain-containing protein [Novosphingobium sp. YJ-S2-02]|uniref:Helix-turn-helix domain-containing protein n=1 Tax=Novosphingobium aureum TaxID=2792964 RepID=A0A931HBU7_9SPHN|nr:helix-turn-helix domain-containing protein [Novosphingobium aureum]MBH0112589.1 helix-turn-helix domain-containing protein [Novosphingobium aureum]